MNSASSPPKAPRRVDGRPARPRLALRRALVVEVEQDHGAEPPGFVHLGDAQVFDLEAAVGRTTRPQKSLDGDALAGGAEELAGLYPRAHRDPLPGGGDQHLGVAANESQPPPIASKTPSPPVDVPARLCGVNATAAPTERGPTMADSA